MSKAHDLARLAADERTPDGERIAAALALAKIVARDGVPQPSRINPFTYSSVSEQELHTLRRERDALAEIARQNATEIQTLRGDKAELEEMIRWIRDEARATLRRMGR